MLIYAYAMFAFGNKKFCSIHRLQTSSFFFFNLSPLSTYIQLAS